MNYRYANEKDYDFIKKHDKHLPKNLILLKINNNEIIFVKQDNEIVGWLRFGFFWDNIPFINMLWIDELYRGKGIGGGVIQFWENEMKSKNFNLVMTSTLSNEDAQHFYRKMGYKDAGGLLLEDEPLEIFLVKNLG